MRKTADIRKAEIVATVLGLADRIGPDRVTTGAVAAAIGLTHAAFFRHFPTKAAMWEAVARHTVAEMKAAWEAGLPHGETPVQRLRALIAAQLDQIAATPALPVLLFSRELNVENPELRAAFRDALGAYRALIIREVAAGQEAGEIRRGIAAEDAALLLTALVQGVAIRWALGARDFALREEGLRLFDVQLGLLSQETR